MKGTTMKTGTAYLIDPYQAMIDAYQTHWAGKIPALQIPLTPIEVDLQADGSVSSAAIYEALSGSYSGQVTTFDCARAGGFDLWVDDEGLLKSAQVIWAVGEHMLAGRALVLEHDGEGASICPKPDRKVCQTRLMPMLRNIAGNTEDDAKGLENALIAAARKERKAE